MDKKRLIKSLEPDDLKGFEEFIEGQPQDTNFLPRGVGGGSKKSETSFEHFTFLTNDSIRLTKVKQLLSEKLPFSAKFDQSDKLINEQKEELEMIRQKLFEVCDSKDSAYRKSLQEIFDPFFSPTET